ncbi:MAG TPA: hypothetical protein VFC68_07060, partial [Treponemataceae bacterium]|nr:hypothetical protein [Treponemataceae bacterium]
IVLFFMPIFALGKKENSFKEIDVLIEKKELNEAVKKLDEYIKYNPQDFDNAQNRIELILKTRERYKEVADKLVEFQEYLKENPLENTPENNKIILDYINELEKMEINQNIQQQKFISQLKDASLFIYYNSVFEQIMHEGLKLSKAGNYVDSVYTYTEGFVLYRDEFYESGYDKTMVNTVDSLLKKINTDLLVFKNLQIKLADVFGRFNLAVDAGDFFSAQNIYVELESIIIQLATIRNNTAKTGMYLKNTFAELQADNPEGMNDSSFLPFAYRFILGKESDTSTGILATIDSQWDFLLTDAKTHLIIALENRFNSIANAIPSESVEQTAEFAENSKADLLSVSQFLEMGKNVHFLYLRFNEAPRGYTSDMFPEYAQALAYGDTLVEQGVKMLDIASNIVSDTKGHELIVIPESENDAYISAVLDYSSKLKEYHNALDIVYSHIREDRQIQTPEILTLSTALPWENVYSCFTVLNDSTHDYKTAMQCNVWKNMAAVVAKDSTKVVDEYRQILDKTTNHINEPLDVNVSSRPDTAQELLHNAEITFEADVEFLNNKVELLKSAPDSATASIEKFVEQAENNVFVFNSFSQKITNLLFLAKERISLAKRAENEAELRFSQSENYLNSEDFDNARESLQKASEKYSESLLYMDSESARAIIDSKLQSLGIEIARKENEYIVRLVRSLKTQARENYYQGNFEVAEGILLEARSKWGLTNVDSDSEIENLIALVKTAISMKTGRVIYPTDPLYPEMSQILNIANQYYNEGYDLIKEGSREKALVTLEKAKSKLRELQIMYPINQQASLLSLRIDKLINPETFDDFFEQKYNVAKTEYKNTTTRQQAYIDLLDLYEINPSYPGLKDFIYTVEVDLGIRIPPPDKVAIRRSLELTKEAQSLYNANRNDEIILNQALIKLDAAIKLDVNNEQAAILKDRINTSLGGQALVVLPSAQQAIYQQAIQELQRGNVIEATALVLQLWADPVMRRSPIIIDLKNKVDSQL